MISLTELGRRIKLARESAGFSQQALAERLGLDQSGISRMEQGRDLTTSQLVQIAAETNRPYDFFLNQAGPTSTAALFRTGGASEESVQDAAALLEQLADDYEFLLQLTSP